MQQFVWPNYITDQWVEFVHHLKWMNWQEGLKLFTFTFFKSPSVTQLVFIGAIYQGAFASKRQRWKKFDMNSVNLVPLLEENRDQLFWDGHFYFHDLVDHFSICSFTTCWQVSSCSSLMFYQTNLQHIYMYIIYFFFLFRSLFSGKQRKETQKYTQPDFNVY